jgi:hypothetical protein
MTDPIEALADERASEVPEDQPTKARGSAPRATVGRPTPVTWDRHPGFRAHRMGHREDAPIATRPAVLTEWDTRIGNGAGLVNCAAWARRIEAEGIGTGFAEDFLRGLIHR